MFANFTGETCTGTGATLALAGALYGKIPFSESFADGALVAYVVEDSGGTIKVAGVGTYVSATDDITRNDTWNWNGTAIDDNPSTNITLSGGTHTVRCDIAARDIIGNNMAKAIGSSTDAGYGFDLLLYSSGTSAFGANALDLGYVMLLAQTKITNLHIAVTTADGSATYCKAAIYSNGSDGEPDELLAEASFDATSTGTKKTALASPINLKAGIYWVGVVSDSASVQYYSFDFNDKMIGTSVRTNGRSEVVRETISGGTLPTTSTSTTKSGTDSAQVWYT